MTDYDGFRVERDEERGVATITLDVPGKLNRVSLAARQQLVSAFGELGRDESRARGRGDGSRRDVHGRRRHRLVPHGAGRRDVVARLQRRSPGALPEAGDRADRGLLPRRRVRALARVRLPDLLRRRQARPAGDRPRDDPRLGRNAAARAARRAQPREGRDHAAEADHGRRRARLGARVGGRAGSRAGRCGRPHGRRAERRCRRSRWRWPSGCSTMCTTARSTSASSSRASPTACSSRPTTSARASSPSSRNARRRSRDASAGGTVPERRSHASRAALAQDGGPVGAARGTVPERGSHDFRARVAPRRLRFSRGPRRGRRRARSRRAARSAAGCRSRGRPSRSG